MKQPNEKEVAKLLVEQHYVINEDVLRRVDWYPYKDTTVISVNEDSVVIRTEMPIKGVYDTLIIYPDGKSEVKMEFDK